MAVSRITREDMVEQSVSDFIRNAIFVEREYPADQVELLDAFDPARFEAMNGLDKNYLSLGFSYDPGGTPIELGSNLVQRRYSIEVWVMALTPLAGRNLANATREAIEHAGLIPLKDISQQGAPVIDQLIVDPVHVQRQPVGDPQPWQENLWLVTVPVIDEFYP